MCTCSYLPEMHNLPDWLLVSFVPNILKKCVLLCINLDLSFQYVAQSQPEADPGTASYWMQGPVQPGGRYYRQHSNVYVNAPELPAHSYQYHAVGQTGRGPTAQMETAVYQGPQYGATPRTGRVQAASIQDYAYPGERMA